MNVARLNGDTIDWVIVVDDIQWAIDNHGGNWIDITDNPEIGMKWTTPDGGTTWVPPVKVVAPPITRYNLTGKEWVGTFTPTEWQWLKTQRTTDDELDLMMDAIRWSETIHVRAGGPLDDFYQWLLDNGLPGGQTRVDELRVGIDD